MRSFAAVLILLIAVFAGIIFYFWATSGPVVSITPDTGSIGATRELTVKLRAPRGPLKGLTVAAVQGDKRVEVLARKYPAGGREATGELQLLPRRA